MKSFTMGQKVLVKKNEDGVVLHLIGKVNRVCSDGGGWVALDKRVRDKELAEKVHPFPRGDAREVHVKAFPEDCELTETNRRERRAAMKVSKQPAATIETFGKDHWSTFAYIETLCVDSKGEPDHRRMRCIEARHPLLANGHDASAYLTRLKGGAVIENHDDWDCVEDLELAGLLENVGTGVRPTFKLTKLGQQVSAELRVHKQEGGNFASFEPKKR